jgi:hypothetical protein
MEVSSEPKVVTPSLTEVQSLPVGNAVLTHSTMYMSMRLNNPISCYKGPYFRAIKWVSVDGSNIFSSHDSPSENH